ncbi:MAG: pilus assembly protein N-terminal domain-containing protein [Planctomycetota bacterium]
MTHPNHSNDRTRKVAPALFMAAGAVGLAALAAYSVFNGPADALSASPDFLAETAMLENSTALDETVAPIIEQPVIEVAPVEPIIGAPRIVRDPVAATLAHAQALADAQADMDAEVDSEDAFVEPYEVVEPDGFDKPVAQIELPEQTLGDVVATAEPMAPEPKREPVQVAVKEDQPEQPAIADVDSTTDTFVREGLSERGDVRMAVAGSQVITTNRPFTRVSVGSPDIAEVNPLGVDSLLVTAKEPGHTQLIIWDEDEKSEMIQVAVEPDFAALRDAMDAAFPDEDVEITPVGNTIAMRGRVSDIDTAEQILEVASTFSDDVVNLLEIGGGQTVMLRVRFAEVSRDMSRQLGLNFGFQDGPTIFGSNIGNIATQGILTGPELAIPQGPQTGSQFFFTGSIDNAPFAGFVNALKDANLLRMLSEPNVTVMSGEKGTMLAGGEIPIPVPQENQITIEYKEFGVRLDYVPTVLGDGNIRLKLDTRSSDLDFSRAVTLSGLQVPALRTKENTTTVELAPGQTLVIGGLLENRITANRESIPGLGELPIVGALFRSVRYQREESELVVMVTPMLVEPMNPAEVFDAPGENWRHPNDAELFGEGSFGEDLSNQPAEMPEVEAEVEAEVIEAETTGVADGTAPDAVAIKEDEVVVVESETTESVAVPVEPEADAPAEVEVEAEVEAEATPEASADAIDKQPRRETSTPVVIEAPAAEEPAEEVAEQVEEAAEEAAEVPAKTTATLGLPPSPHFIGFIGFSKD